MTFAPGPTGPRKSSRERFFEEDAVGLPNWLIDRARKLAFNVGGDLESRLNALAGEWEKTLAASDLTHSNSPIVSAIARFFAEHGPPEVRAVMERTFIGMSEEYGEDGNARASGARPEYDGHLITVNAELEYDLARAADLYSAYVQLNRVSQDAAPSEQTPAIALVMLCLDILGYRKALAPDVFDWISEERRASFDRVAGDLLVWGLAFVLGHELGHHVLGHTTGPPDPQRDERYKKELEADHFATRVLFESARAHPDYSGTSLALLAGPLVALTAMAIEQADPAVGGDTHPSAAERWARVNESARAYVHDDERIAMLRLFENVNGLILKRLELWPERWW